MALPERHVPTRLFAPVSGLIVESRTLADEAPVYYFLQDPLAQPVQMTFPAPGHELVHASSDVPVLVSRDGERIVVWAMRKAEVQPDELMPEVEEEDDDNDDPFASFVRHAAAGETDGELQPPPDVPQPTASAPVLTRLFDIPASVEDALSVFLAHDLRGRLVLCLCMGGVLTGLSFSLDGMDVLKMKPSFCIRDVTSAAPVFAVRRHQNCLDVLVRHASGQISLFMGRNRLCSVVLDDPPQAAVEGRREHERRDKALAVCDAVGAEFGLRDSQGFVVRYELRGAAFSSPLVNACLSAISFTFEAAGIMLRLTTLYHDILAMCGRRGDAGVGKDCDDHDWVIFERVLLQTSAEAGKHQDDQQNDAMDTGTDDSVQDDLNDREGTEEDWMALLNSEYHKWRNTSSSLGPLRSRDHVPIHGTGEGVDLMVPDVETLRHVLQSLHLVYEDQKLCQLAPNSALRLVSLNIRLAKAVGSVNFIDHYRRDYGNLDVFGDDELSPLASPEHAPVPSIMDYLSDLVRGELQSLTSFPVMLPTNLSDTQCAQLTASWRAQSPASISARVVSYYECLYGPSQREASLHVRAESLLLAMVEDNFCRTDLEALPFGIALPLQDALFSCRQNPKSSWRYRAFALIGREDLFNFSHFDLERGRISKQEFDLINESRALLQIQAAASSLTQTAESWLPDRGDNLCSFGREGPKQNSAVAYSDGCEMQTHLFRLRFSADRRVEEVRRILRSTDPVIITAPENPHPDSLIDFDLASEQKRKLERLVRKRYAAPVGRGAYTLRTFVPSDPTKPLSVPKICVRGVLFSQKGSRVTLQETDLIKAQWGEFHNGVASGLRIVAAQSDEESDSGQILTRAWIVNHRPSDSSGSANHAGMLLALGLGGYLPALRTTDYYEYLVPRHDLTSIGLMIGLAAGNLGSMHEKITKMLCVHVKYFNGPGFAVPDFHVPVNVQTAAILGLGLLHQGSCEHLIVDGLFTELGRRPKPGDDVSDREGLALAAGVSIGLVCLGNGSSAFDAADGRLIDRLVLYANGGPGDTVDTVASHFETVSLKGDVGAGQERSNPAAADSEASRVKEGNFVNMDVVSPGALLSLALIYLKTNDKRMADRIVIPDTLYNLDRARPDHVFLRVLVRSLIMWDDIQASREWIVHTLPGLLRPTTDENNSRTFDLRGKIAIGGTYTEHDVDVPGIIHARAFATAGACTAIALKYAGTNEPSAISLLYNMCEAFEKALLQEENHNEPVTWVFMTCLCSASLAIAVVASGSGNLDVFRLLRRLRKRRGRPLGSGRYGYHLAMHMAIGFLFMGGGCQTFGTSNMAITGLLCAIYPRFPEDVDDNQFHLQAMRHLYVLATEPRCIETRDVDTGMPCCVDVEIKLKNGSVLKTKAPCIVPEAGRVRSVSVISERYCPTTVQINPAIPGYGWYSSTNSQALFVKRRTGHLPHSSDPKGSKGIVARSLSRPRSMSGHSSSYFAQVDHLVRAFSADADLLAFVKYFCSPGGRPSQTDGAACLGNDRARRHVEWLFECLSNDKAEAVRTYMNAERASTAVLNGQASPSIVGSLMVVDSYIQSIETSSTPLLQPAYLSRLLHQVRETVNPTKLREALLKYVWSGGRSWPSTVRSENESRNVVADLGILLRLDAFPPPCRLGELTAALKRTVSSNGNKLEYWLCFAQGNVDSAKTSAMESIMTALEA